MSKTKYFVLFHEERWKIRLDGVLYGPYSSQQSAIRAAVGAARKTDEEGAEALVVVQDPEKQLWTELTHAAVVGAA
jgi:hypothetical protein